jgi:hypothetical protein
MGILPIDGHDFDRRELRRETSLGAGQPRLCAPRISEPTARRETSSPVAAGAGLQTVVGVVGDASYDDLKTTPPAPTADARHRRGTMQIRSTLEPGALVGSCAKRCAVSIQPSGSAASRSSRRWSITLLGTPAGHAVRLLRLVSRHWRLSGFYGAQLLGGPAHA